MDYSTQGATSVVNPNATIVLYNRQVNSEYTVPGGTFRSTSSYVSDRGYTESTVLGRAGRTYAPASSAFVSASSFQPVGNGSFVNINNEVVAYALNDAALDAAARNGQYVVQRRPTDPAVGEEDVPIGDGLLPMLVCAAMYVVVRSKHRVKHLLFKKTTVEI